MALEGGTRLQSSTGPRARRISMSTPPAGTLCRRSDPASLLRAPLSCGSLAMEVRGTSLYERTPCSRKDGGCGHARHRHTRAPGSVHKVLSNGVCRAVGSDGRCPCLKFVESQEARTYGQSRISG